MQKFFEIVFPVIDHNICTEALNQIEIRRARCRCYNCTKMLRQLNRECSDTPRARVDENFLPFLQVGSLDQRLPSGKATRGMEAASSMVSFLGVIATASSFIEMSSAKEPIRSWGGRA